MTLYFAVTFLFIIGLVALSATALYSQSFLRYFVPVFVGSSFVVAYMSLDMVSGSAKIHNAVPGWTYPDMENGDVTVLGGAPFSAEGAYLMVQEDGKPPVLLRFKSVGGFQQKMKEAMQKQAKQNNGNPWGFKMRKAKGKPGNGKAGQDGKPGKEGEGGPDQDQSLEDRENLYVFEPPQARELPDKPYESERVIP